jgi:predicted O-methyltransferase YrrM
MSYSLTQKTARYIAYRKRARTKFGLHSPFLYELAVKVLDDKRPKKEYSEIESLRKKLKSNHTPVEITDMGAGSGAGPGNEAKKVRRIKSIVLASAVRPKYGKLLFRLSGWFKPKTILELGTSLGIGSMYLAEGNPSAELITIEGSAETARLAQENFVKLEIKNIRSLTGSFDQVLPQILKDNPLFDLIYIDGNHQYEATLRYYSLLKDYINNDSLIIFDDIHWSKEMEQAWHEICSKPEVTVSVDLFQFGLVFFSKKLSKQHFVIRF